MAINSISHQDVTEEALLICQIEELEVRRAYSSHKSLATDYVYACLSVKNIGKPCAGEPQARFDEEGQGKTCSLLYLFLPKIITTAR